MKKYIKPTVEIAIFDVEDIITSSGMIVNGENFTGKNEEMYNVYKQNSSADNTNVAVFTW